MTPEITASLEKFSSRLLHVKTEEKEEKRREKARLAKEKKRNKMKRKRK